MNQDFEEIDISFDSSFEALERGTCGLPFPAATFGKGFIYLNRRATRLLSNITYVGIRKNDKYILIIPEKIKSRFSYKPYIQHGCAVICAAFGTSSGFYPTWAIGKSFKVKKIKSGGIAICLEEAV